MKRIKELREARRMTQLRLAMELNISQGMVSKYELGISEPDISMIRLFAKFFRVSTDYLLEITDEKTNVSYSGLSDDEKALLYDFKRLSETNRVRAMAYLQGLVDGVGEKTDL